MRIFETAIIIIVVLCSCGKEKQSLTGSWEYDHTRKFHGLIFDIPVGDPILIFLNDSTVDTRVEHFSETYYKGILKTRYTGMATKYRLNNDSLSVYDLDKDRWSEPYIVVEQTKDSLVLRKLLQEHVYRKFEYPADKPHLLDQIVLSSSGCHGRCPIMNISIRSNGDVFYYGEKFVDNIGYYTAKLSLGKFEEIEQEFNRADYDTLRQYYSSPVSDSESISTTFLKGNKIINSIDDHGDSLNAYLEWAYPTLRYLTDQLDLTRLDSSRIPFHYSLWDMRFMTMKEDWWIKKSEAFLLWNYLRTADTIPTKSINTAYKLEYWSNTEKNEVAITTDGRFYQFKTANTTTTLDIGFNFLEANPKIVHFKPIEKLN